MLGGWHTTEEAGLELGLAPRTVKNYLGWGRMQGERVQAELAVIWRGRVAFQPHALWLVHSEELDRFRGERDAKRAKIARARAGGDPRYANRERVV